MDVNKINSRRGERLRNPDAVTGEIHVFCGWIKKGVEKKSNVHVCETSETYDQVCVTCQDLRKLQLCHRKQAAYFHGSRREQRENTTISP